MSSRSKQKQRLTPPRTVCLLSDWLISSAEILMIEVLTVFVICIELKWFVSHVMFKKKKKERKEAATAMYHKSGLQPNDSHQ